MNMANAERQQTENEIFSSRINKNADDSLWALDAMHIEDGNMHLLGDEDLLLLIKCECSDENRRVCIPCS